MSGKLRQALEQVAVRYRRVRLWTGLAACWLVLALLGCAVAAVGPGPLARILPAGGIPGLLLLLAGACWLAFGLFASRSARDPRWVARRIENAHPELNAELLAAVEEVESAPGGRLGYLQSTVVREALEHRRAHDWDQTVPSWKLSLAGLAHTGGLVFLAAVVGFLVLRERTSAHGSGGSYWQTAESDVQVEPGDVELERGSPLLVVARFFTPPPADATLVIDGDVPGGPRRSMARSLEDPAFAGRIESVPSDLSYRVEFDGRTTPSYRVRIFEYPELKRADAHLVFPDYTHMPPRIVEDVRHVTAVEGTALTLVCRLNKDVAAAELIDKQGAIPLVRDESQPHTYRAKLVLADPRRLKVRLLDAQGRVSPIEPEIAINVTRNKPPTIAITRPGHDVEVSPLEELELHARIEDDFGLIRHGISYSTGGDEPKDIVLAAPKPKPKGAAGSAPAKDNPKPPLRIEAEHMIDFEAMKAVPDQLVSYTFWAEDIGPDGAVRRTSSDMFFAEVRPFEQVFRQGEPPSGSAEMQGQQGQNAQEAGQLAELERQIISGIWKLIRRETRPRPTAEFVPDATTLRDSQKAVLDQASQLGERLRDATSRAALQQALKAMTEAGGHLGQAVDGPSIPPLRPALTAAQTASQALLKLRAREIQVIRSSRQNRNGRSGNSASRRQLQQLELKPDENRFEEQRTARSQENQTQREREQAENRQVLNRLRELAQRQRDLNERLKEIQSALEAAKTPEARAELERQLKRLRDQQREILRDTDELRERMENEENQQRMAEARQEVQQGRENLRKASDALEHGRIPQAITEGARAGERLNNLRERFRNETSNRFAEEMNRMRSEARRLDEDQKKINEKLDAWQKQPERSLRESDERKQLRQASEQQTKKADEILDRMRQTTQDAEETEPLLARNLYDTVRQANEQKVSESLKATQQLVDVGIPEEAARAAQHAGRGIEDLRKGIEHAAESVLGDETAALRRARNELDDLANQVNREIAQNNPQRNRPGQNAGNADDQQRQPRDGQSQPRDGQARSEPGQNREGKASSEPGNQQRDGQQQGQRDGQQQGQRDGQQQGQRDGQQQGQRDGQQQGQPGDQPPGERQGGQPGERQAGGLRGGNENANRPERLGGDRMVNGPHGGPGGPITGGNFRQWSDRMRDVEELLDDPDWRADAARIRDRVRGAREEFRRHSRAPDWTRLNDLVTNPINELRKRIGEELQRRESPDALVPIDRDPVPPRFAEGVRRYYERLGSGR